MEVSMMTKTCEEYKRKLD